MKGTFFITGIDTNIGKVTPQGGWRVNGTAKGLKRSLKK